MHRRISGILIASLLLAVSTARAGGQGPLTWEESLAEARAHHPDILAQQERLKQAEADASLAYSGLYPRLAAQAGAVKTDQPGESYSASLSASQLLFDGFGTAGSARAADENVRLAQYQLDAVSADLRYGLRAAFIGLLKTQAMVSLTEAIAERRKQNVDLVQLRYKAGREHEGSLLTAEAELAQAEFEIEQSRRAVGLARNTLAKAMGWEKPGPETLAGDFAPAEEYAAQPDFGLLADRNPNVQELLSAQRAAQARVQSAYAEFYPQLNVSLSAGLQDNSWPLEDGSWSAGLNLSWPLFSGGSRLAQVKKTEAGFEQAKQAARGGRDGVLVGLQEAWNGLQDALGQLTVRKKYLAAAEDRATIATGQYSAGLIAFDDWVIIEDNLVNAQKALLNAQSEVVLAEAKWIQAKGGTL